MSAIVRIGLTADIAPCPFRARSPRDVCRINCEFRFKKCTRSMHRGLNMVRALVIFFACTTVVLAAAIVWLVAPQFQRESQDARADQDIVFPAKLFLGTKAYVAAKGTLSADWIAYKNNTFSILCLPEECLVASVEQIGPKQVGNIDGPTSYPTRRGGRRGPRSLLADHNYARPSDSNGFMGRDADQSNYACLRSR